MHPMDPQRGTECPQSFTGYHNLQFVRIVNDHFQESQWICKDCFAIVNKCAFNNQSSTKGDKP